MESYAAILIVLLVLSVSIASWVFFGKVMVLKVAEYMAYNQDAYEAEAAASAERAEKRAAKRAAKEETDRKAEEEQMLREAAAMCPNCKFHHAPPSAVSDITDLKDCCDRHKSAPAPAPVATPHKTVFSVASTDSTV